MTVTSIKQVNNNADFILEILNPASAPSNEQKIEVLQPKENKGTDVWIPWMTRTDGLNMWEVIQINAISLQIPGHEQYHMILGYIWQKDDQVKFGKSGSGIICIPTYCKTGGDRLLIARGTSYRDATIELTRLP
jgi:hypothetical protein